MGVRVRYLKREEMRRGGSRTVLEAREVLDRLELTDAAALIHELEDPHPAPK